MPKRLLKSTLFALAVAAVILVHLSPAGASSLNGGEEICNVSADQALGSEDYAQAIRLHQRLVAVDRTNALAHYHLGFAYGIVGQRQQEIAEYRRAIELGLRQWDLYLNLGRVYLESHEYPAAIEVLATAETLGPNHPETHFNLGLAYERQQRLVEAEQEMLAALRLGADPADAGNMLAVIYAEDGKWMAARSIWSDLARHGSSAEVARANLALLDHLVVVGKGGR